MNKQQAIEFAQMSASMAVDMRDDYGDLEASIASHRDNIRDTLKDERSSEWETVAWEEFDLQITELLSRECL